MDYNVTLLVFGILLLLLGLVGKVKAKEIEVGTSSATVRIITVILGSFLMVFSFNPDIPKTFLVKLTEDVSEPVDAEQTPLEEDQATIAKLEKSISESEKANRILFETLIPKFWDQVEELIKSESNSDPATLGFQILEINDNFLTIKFFKKLFFTIDDSHQYILQNTDKLNDLQLDEERRSELLDENNLNRSRISFLTSFMYLHIHDVDGDQAENPLALFLSNYILLVTYSMNDQYAEVTDFYSAIDPSRYPKDNFIERLKEINNKFSVVARERIIKQLSQEFVSDLQDIKLADNERSNDRKNLIDEILTSRN